jgi:hypothetical protein
MNFVLFFAQIKQNIWSLYKFGRVIAFLTLFYQIILVTISYLKYEIVIDMKAVLDIEQRPAFTFCLYSGKQFPKTTKMFGHPFRCNFIIEQNQQNITCN